MDTSSSHWHNHLDDKEHAYRLLKKLKIALLFWLVSFVFTVIWFSNSPAF